MTSPSPKTTAIAAAITLALAGAPAASAQTQPGNSGDNRRCPQGQVPQGNTGYCVPNPGQSRSQSKKKKKSKQSLGRNRFRNTSGGERDGKTFTVVRRNGRTFHVYTGPPREVVEVT